MPHIRRAPPSSPLRSPRGTRPSSARGPRSIMKPARPKPARKKVVRSGLDPDVARGRRRISTPLDPDVAKARAGRVPAKTRQGTARSMSRNTLDGRFAAQTRRAKAQKAQKAQKARKARAKRTR